MSDQSEDSVVKELVKAPVITIDGPSGTGKGTIAKMLSKELSYHLLDSGALYRLLALSAQNHDVSVDNEEGLTVLARHLDVQFDPDAEDEIGVILEGENVTQAIRTEEIGYLASKVATVFSVREALMGRQHAFREMPGLVADGRDMGTVVFKDAETKIFLTASAEERAERRYKQLKAKGQNASLADLAESIRSRDERDINRSISPLVPAEDATVIDTSDLSIAEVFSTVLKLVID